MALYTPPTLYPIALYVYKCICIEAFAPDCIINRVDPAASLCLSSKDIDEQQTPDNNRNDVLSRVLD